MAQPKPKKAKAEPKLETAPSVPQFKIPARYIYGESPFGIAMNYTANEVADFKPDSELEGIAFGDFLIVRNTDCDEAFIIHKDVLAELAKAVG